MENGQPVIPIQTILSGCDVSVQPSQLSPNPGDRDLIIQHPFGQVWILPLSKPAADSLADDLRGSGLSVASDLPEAG